MLFKKLPFVDPKTFELLQTLSSDENLADFFLVGGTALALQIGHRLSIDLGFFTQSDIDTEQLGSYLFSKYNFQIDSVAKNMMLGFVGNVKIDMITHAYPLVNPIMKIDKVRLVSIEDIAAMKLNAISHSGQRLKDFMDVYFLLEKMSFDKMLSAYQIKYPNSNPMIVLKSITYFNDIDFNVDPPGFIIKKVSTKKLEKRLKMAVLKPYKIF